MWENPKLLKLIRYDKELYMNWHKTFEDSSFWLKLGWGVLTGLIILFLFLYFSDNACAEEDYTDSVLNHYIELAVSNNPTISATRAKYEVAKQKAKQAGALPDPDISLGLSGQSIQTKLGPILGKVSISQPIPNPGKLSLKAKIALEEVKVASVNITLVKQQIIYRVKKLYANLGFINEAISITNREKIILETMRQVALRKYETGLTSQQDPIKADVAITKLINKLYELNQQKESLLASLIDVFGVSDELIQNDIKQLGFGWLESGSITNTLDNKKLPALNELLALAEQNQQTLKIAKLKVKESGYAQQLANLRSWPDFGLGFEYTNIGDSETTMPKDGTDAWMVMGKATLPIWVDQNQAAKAEKEAENMATKELLKKEQNQTRYEVQDLYFQLQRLAKTISLYKTTLIPLVNQSYEAARISYESGDTDFLNWLSTEERLLEIQVMYKRTIADQKIAWAELERAIGKE